LKIKKHHRTLQGKKRLVLRLRKERVQSKVEREDEKIRQRKVVRGR
jgi:hypothetical protein